MKTLRILTRVCYAWTNNTNRINRTLALGLAIVVLGFSILTFAEGAEEVVKVGAIWPLTGSLGALGQMNRQGIEMAVDIINSEYPDLNLPFARSAGLPNLGGARIEVIWADSRGMPEQGRSSAEYLITEENVVALMGCYQSAVTETASLAAELYGIPFLNPDSSSPKLTERGFTYFWRCTPLATVWTENVFQFFDDANEKYGTNLSTLAIAHEDTLWGTEAADWVEYFAEEYNYEVVERVKYPQGTIDLSAEVLRIRVKDPDILQMAGYISDNILMNRTLKDYNWLPKVIVAGEMIQVPTFLESLGEDGNYYFLTILFPPDLLRSRDITRAVDEMLSDRYGAKLDDTTARAFTGVFVLADAINRAGSADPEAINAAFAETSIPGEKLILPWESIEFDENHQLIAGSYTIMQIIDQEYCTVWPWHLAEVEPILPMPNWER